MSRPSAHASASDSFFVSANEQKCDRIEQMKNLDKKYAAEIFRITSEFFVFVSVGGGIAALFEDSPFGSNYLYESGFFLFLGAVAGLLKVKMVAESEEE